MLRYADFRIDSSSIQDLPDGSIKVTGRFAHSCLVTYRNPDGSPRTEYRPKEEVFNKASMATFAGAPVTINHPVMPNGSRLVTADSWKSVASGHLGDNIRDRKLSAGYQVDYDPTPGTTPTGERFDGVQRGMRGNHVALVPPGMAPRQGGSCELRLDAEGNELTALNSGVDQKDIDALNQKVADLTAELAKTRTDAVTITKLEKDLGDAKTELAAFTPERLDALVEERASVCAAATACGVDPKGKTTLAVKRAVVAKRTPRLADRVDAMDASALDACLAVYAEEPHPSMAAAVAVTSADPAVRTDASNKPLPRAYELYEASVKASRDAWKNKGDFVR